MKPEIAKSGALAPLVQMAKAGTDLLSTTMCTSRDGGLLHSSLLACYAATGSYT